MSPAAGPSPPSAGPPVDGPSPTARRRWRFGILAGVLGACALAVIVALALRPAEPDGYGPEPQASIEAACRRAAPDVDDPSAACRCAYQRLAESLPFERLTALEDEMRRRDRPTPELVAVTRGCRADQG
jgi:hypothetical protein